MQLADHYIRLAQKTPVGQQLPIPLEEVANILCCTARNAKLVLKKLAEHNWVHWQPGRGRGNRSLLTLQIAPDDLLYSLAIELVQKGDLPAASALVESYRDDFLALPSRFQTWLSSHFGYHVEAREGKAVDTLRITHLRPLFQLDPAHAWLRSEWHLVKHLFDTLVTYDASTAAICPHLAHDWEVSADATEYTFFLRKGVLFHNGTQLTADDVAFTLHRLQTDSLYAWMFADLEEITVHSEQILHLKLRAPNHLFLHILSDPRAAILPQEYFTEIGADFARLPVGSGPFKIVRNDEAMLVLQAFAPYFRERPFLDRIEIWVLPDLDLPASSNEYDIRYTGGGANWNTIHQVERSFQLLTMNLNKPGPLQHPAFREALTLLLDRRQMISDLGGARFALASRFDQSLEDTAAEIAPPDRPLISDLLAESGYDGRPLSLITMPDEDHREDCVWMQQRCQEFGIDLQFKLLDAREMIRSERIGEADMCLDGATVIDHLELSYLDLLRTPSFFIYPHLSKQLRQLTAETISALLQIASGEERRRRLQALESELLEQKVILPLYRNRITISTPRFLHGVSLNSQGWVDYRQLWFKKKDLHS